VEKSGLVAVVAAVAAECGAVAVHVLPYKFGGASAFMAIIASFGVLSLVAFFVRSLCINGGLITP